MYFYDLKTYEDWDVNVGALENKIGVLSDKVKKALEIVEKYHNQPRMFTEGNYNRHPLRVARVLAEELNVIDENSILIALCHDLGEWSDYDIIDLKEEFGDIVYEGVKTLTWNQEGEWSDFVDSIVNSKVKNLIAIKISDKLDNNRAVALSGNMEAKEKARNKTINIIMPLVKKYHPEMLDAYSKSLSDLESN